MFEESRCMCTYCRFLHECPAWHISRQQDSRDGGDDTYSLSYKIVNNSDANDYQLLMIMQFPTVAVKQLEQNMRECSVLTPIGKNCCPAVGQTKLIILLP